MKSKILIQYILILCLLAIPCTMVTAQSTQTAQVGFFQPYNIPTDALVEIPVEIKDVKDLYAIDFQMTFDPTILQVEDADAELSGIQIAQATFLEAGMVLFNVADNTEGTIRFITSQINPSEAKSGDGILFVIYLKGIKEGTSPLTISNLQLADREGNEIPSSKVEDVINVSKDAQQADSTPIPVLNPTQMIILQVTPQIAPTQTATPSDEPTQNQTEEISKTETLSEISQTTQETIKEATEDEKPSKFSLLEYWWIILVLGVIVVFITIYLLKTKNKVH